MCPPTGETEHAIETVLLHLGLLFPVEDTELKLTKAMDSRTVSAP